MCYGSNTSTNKSNNVLVLYQHLTRPNKYEREKKTDDNKCANALLHSEL